MSYIIHGSYIRTLPKRKPGRICGQYIEQHKNQYNDTKNYKKTV